MNSIYDTNTRNGSENDVRLQFYRARVYNTLDENDDRLQVRILPFMENISTLEEANLPCFPSIRKGEVMHLRSEKAVGKEKADYVMVLANNHFTIGYIFCKLNECSGPNKSYAHLFSCQFSKMQDYLSKKDQDISNFNYEDIYVTNWDFDETTGGYVDCYNIKTGDKYILNSSGTLIVIAQNKVYINVGSPAKNINDSNDFSDVEITPSKIEMRSRNIVIDAKDNLRLGTHGLKLAGFSGVIPANFKGQSIIPISNINV